ncbi:MAG: 3'-5' exonuclease [Roseomonas sp.]|nr:3'-5' exonuclease [Roseomonas sp.]MCA3326399.1 3'-5' exonuclease [Roseomonas sp.]MCA3331534.1 3'-5' exonuclease [Roseomonas sp.]MCA3336423.1 3'-5' exonuclease [Roseomonas sp.]MCA3347855.1 3'-5' exonuclease [Roseomonas sp.]
MSGLLRRALGLIGHGLRPPLREFLRARAHFHAALPAGPLIAQNYVVFDLESTGLDVSGGDRAISIGAVRLRNGEIRESFVTLINPARAIPPGSIRYHGITDAMVADALPAAEALARFRDFAADDVLVAHNAAFDRTLIYAEEFRGAPAIGNPFLCSLATSRWLDPEEADHSLDGLCGRAGIVITGRHQALGDAAATAALWVSLMARAAARGVDDLAELVRRSRMTAAMAATAEHF